MFALPAPLSDEASQLNHAKVICARYLNQPSTEAFLCSDQGNYSITVTVNSANNTQSIIQFRDELQDCEPYNAARQQVGLLVPSCTYLPDSDMEAAGIWAYHMSLVPGTTWREASTPPRLLTNTQRIACTRSLGQFYARCILPGSDCSAMVDEYIKPQLSKILAHRDNPAIAIYISAIEHLLATADTVKVLPLAVTHQDLRLMNIMLADDLRSVSGVIDWEYSKPLLKPFGAGFYTFEYLASPDPEVEPTVKYDEYANMNEALWTGVLEECDEALRKFILGAREAVRTSILIGTVLDKIHIDDVVGEDGEARFHMPALVVLEEHLKYKLPPMKD